MTSHYRRPTTAVAFRPSEYSRAPSSHIAFAQTARPGALPSSLAPNLVVDEGARDKITIPSVIVFLLEMPHHDASFCCKRNHHGSWQRRQTCSQNGVVLNKSHLTSVSCEDPSLRFSTYLYLCPQIQGHKCTPPDLP
jgi:hypothetical protein